MPSLADEVRHIDARHWIVGNQFDAVTRRGLTQRPGQPQGRRGATMPPRIDDLHSGAPTTASTEPVVTE